MCALSTWSFRLQRASRYRLWKQRYLLGRGMHAPVIACNYTTQVWIASRPAHLPADDGVTGLTAVWHCRVVRVMPNTPAVIRQAASAYSLGKHATSADALTTHQLMSSIGESRSNQGLLLCHITTVDLRSAQPSSELCVLLVICFTALVCDFDRSRATA